MPILIKLHGLNGKEFFFNASMIFKVCARDDGGSEILDKDADWVKVQESPDTIDLRIDKQIKNLLHGA